MNHSRPSTQRPASPPRLPSDRRRLRHPKDQHSRPRSTRHNEPFTSLLPKALELYVLSPPASRQTSTDVRLSTGAPPPLFDPRVPPFPLRRLEKRCPRPPRGRTASNSLPGELGNGGNEQSTGDRPTMTTETKLRGDRSNHRQSVSNGVYPDSPFEPTSRPRCTGFW